ncbi:MAG: DNA polymerase III subunit alpha [Opitutaceae bacterium]
MEGFAELHARSAFSFLRGSTLPEEMAERAGQLQLPAVALCDRDGVAGAVRFHQKAKGSGVRPLVGSEVSMEDGSVVPLLAASGEGYRNLCALITTAQLRAPKGEGRVGWAELAEQGGGLIALTGDEEGPVRRAWRERGAAAAGEALAKLRRVFGKSRLYVELQRHLLPGEEEENRFLTDAAESAGLPLLATNGPRYAAPAGRPVLDAFTCLRHRTTLDAAGRLLARNGERMLKPAAAMARLFADRPDALENSLRLAERLEFTLADLGYRFPDYPGPPGETMDGYLRKIAFFGAHQRYGGVAGRVRSQLERELGLIAKLGFSGYFLIVWDLCNFAREAGTLAQGRGSAANSVVCYALGITAVDPIGCGLLFERFLSEGRTDWPDIDLDLPSGERREAVIQYVYGKYGRRGAAMTANVITYRGRSAVREAGKVLGFPEDILDRYCRLHAHGDYPHTLELTEQLRMAGIEPNHPRLPALLALCRGMKGLPRHLGQHSGGMVISAGRLDRIVPLENASMPGRVVLQWDKSDCEDMGIIKVDLLGLGMMAVLQETVELCADRGRAVDPARIPKDDAATFELMGRADTIGVFQIESRAQMATLPRMKPKYFYDVAVEVAIIRPGPIHGQAVHPYLARRAGREPVSYPDPRAEPILRRTLGIVLFQEQMLRLAMELGGFTAAEADELRRAIGFTRSAERLERMERRLDEGMRRNGVKDEARIQLRRALVSFALYGFPESHALSFGFLAYVSAWLKVHRPAEFYAALLNCQPMGFYSPASLVQDARRHGIEARPVCVVRSALKCAVESDAAFRLGLGTLRGVRAAAMEAVLAARAAQPFASLSDFLRRTGLGAPERRALAESGALDGLAGDRRTALWRVESQGGEGELFAGEEAGEDALSPLEAMTHLERLQADFRTLALTPEEHPMACLRAGLSGIVRAGDLARARPGDRVRVGGSVITRQRPGTAKGFCFITLEDETGHANAVVSPALFEARRLVINLEAALVITGRVQNEEGVVHIRAERIEKLPEAGLPEQASHDFR